MDLKSLLNSTHTRPSIDVSNVKTTMMERELHEAVTRQALELLFPNNAKSSFDVQCSLLRRLLVDDPKAELTLALLPLGPSQVAASFREDKQTCSARSVGSQPSVQDDADVTLPTYKALHANSAPGCLGSTTEEKNATDAADVVQPNNVKPSAAPAPRKKKKEKKQSSASSSIADAILRLFHIGPRGEAHVIRLVQTIQTVEVESLREDHVTQLFRGNTLGCKIVSTFTASVGQTYLEHIITPLIEYTQKALDSGVHFTNHAHDDEVNHEKREALLTMCLDHVLSSSKACPFTMSTICNHLREIVRQRFPNHTNVALSSFLFLRFFCPAIVSPSPDLFPACVLELSKDLRRALIWIAKALQSLANSTNKEQFGTFEPKNGKTKMPPKAWPMTMDDLETYRSRMLVFFDEVCNRIRPIQENISKNISIDKDQVDVEVVPSSSNSVSSDRTGDIYNGKCISRFDVESLCNLVSDNVGSLAEVIVRQKDIGRQNGFDVEGKLNHLCNSTSSSSSNNSSANGSVSSSPRSSSVATSFLSRIPSFGSGLRSSSNSSSNKGIKTLSSKGSIQSVDLASPSDLMLKCVPLSLEEATLLQGTCRRRNDIIMLEYYYCVMDKQHQRLHDFMQNMKTVEDESKVEFVGDQVWQHVRTDATTSNHQISTYRHESDSTLAMERAHFPVTSAEFYQRLSSFTNRQQWDDACIRCREVERINPSCSVLHSIVRTPSSVLSDRDFVHLQSHGPDVINGHKHVHTLVSTSISRTDCKPIKGLVRGIIDFEGFVIEEDDDDPLGCVATHIKSMDPKGWIPNLFVRSMFSDRQTSILTSVAESLFTSVEDVSL